MCTLASPADEGLYGLGARKDRFDQRGLLRNVWRATVRIRVGTRYLPSRVYRTCVPG